MKNCGIPAGLLIIIFVRKYHNYSLFTFHYSLGPVAFATGPIIYRIMPAKHWVAR